MNGNLSIGFSGGLDKDPEMEKLVLEALSEFKNGQTKRLDFSQSIHQKIIDDL